MRSHAKIQGKISKTEQNFEILKFLEIEIVPDLTHKNQHKEPFKNYVILLGGGGEVTKRLHKITRGEGGIHQKITLDYKGRGSIWFNHSIDKVSNKI